MPSRRTPKALIIGAGIGGLSAGIALRKAELEVAVFDRRHDRSELEVGGGIVMWPNAVRAMRLLGVADDVVKRAIRVTRVEHRSADGRLLAVWPLHLIESAQNAPSITISRANLHPVLDRALGDVPVMTGAECTSFTQKGSTVIAHFADGHDEEADLLVCADGRNSTLRRKVANVDGSYPPYAGYTLWSAVVRAPHPGTRQGVFTIIHGPAAEFYVFHMGPGEVYWSCAGWLPQQVRGRRFDADNKAAVSEWLRGWCEPVPSLLAATDDGQIARRDIYGGTPLATWSVGRVALLGDAAHPMTPTQGQGACAAIEDALELQRCLKPETDFSAALRQYEKRRRSRTDALMRVSKQIESLAPVTHPALMRMRDHMIGMVFGKPWLMRRTPWYRGMTTLV